MEVGRCTSPQEREAEDLKLLRYGARLTRLNSGRGGMVTLARRATGLGGGDGREAAGSVLLLLLLARLLVLLLVLMLVSERGRGMGWACEAWYYIFCKVWWGSCRE